MVSPFPTFNICPLPSVFFFRFDINHYHDNIILYYSNYVIPTVKLKKNWFHFSDLSRLTVPIILVYTQYSIGIQICFILIRKILSWFANRYIIYWHYTLMSIVLPWVYSCPGTPCDFSRANNLLKTIYLI